MSDMISLGVKMGTRKKIMKYPRSLYFILWTIRRIFTCMLTCTELGYKI
jgi:hypothetical protein